MRLSGQRLSEELGGNPTVAATTIDDPQNNVTRVQPSDSTGNIMERLFRKWMTGTWANHLVATGQWTCRAWPESRRSAPDQWIRRRIWQLLFMRHRVRHGPVISLGVKWANVPATKPDRPKVDIPLTDGKRNIKMTQRRRVFDIGIFSRYEYNVCWISGIYRPLPAA